MSGHSKWHNIRLRKGAQDAKRGNLFTKLAKEIIMAAKAGGGNPDTNLRLRMAIAKAREASMPADKIKNNIQRGTGEGDGAQFEEIVYEGYGPGGAAFVVECATDNKNRTVGNIRSIFNKNGGRLSESGSVAYRFEDIGVITLNKSAIDEDALFEIAIEAGAEDVSAEDEVYTVTAQPGDFGTVRQAIENANLAMISADFTKRPMDTVTLDEKDTEAVLRLMDKLEDDDDVQKVHVNVEMTDEALAAA